MIVNLIINLISNSMEELYQAPPVNNIAVQIEGQEPDKLPLYEEIDKVSGYLDLKENDCIYMSTFEMMIKEAFRADKDFILAKMSTRSNSDPTRSIH